MTLKSPRRLRREMSNKLGVGLCSKPRGDRVSESVHILLELQVGLKTCGFVTSLYLPLFVCCCAFCYLKFAANSFFPYTFHKSVFMKTTALLLKGRDQVCVHLTLSRIHLRMVYTRCVWFGSSQRVKKRKTYNTYLYAGKLNIL